MSSALFIVTSPLQLLCATEAFHHYGISSGDLIIKIGGNPTSNDMLQSMLEDYNVWNSIEKISKKQSLRDLIKVVRGTPNEPYDYIFNAEFNGWFQNVIVANTRYKKRIIYDDGTMTLNDYRVYFAPRIASTKKHIEKELLLRLAGINNFRPACFEHIELFTMFELEELDHVTVIENRFSASASYRKNVISDPAAPIGILGQPLVEAGIVSKNYYIESLKRLTRERKALYFPHRAESEENIAKWKQETNIEVVRDDRPIELSIASYSVSSIVGFISTALKTLSLLYPQLEIQFVRTPDNEFLTEKFRINANNTYQQYVGERVSELEFDE